MKASKARTAPLAAETTVASPAAPAGIAPCADPSVLLFEVAWEVCHQLGGIYQVLRSKVPAMVERWDDRYCLIGPLHDAAAVEFEPQSPPATLAAALQALADEGIDARYGRWLVSGRPQVVLIDHRLPADRLALVKYFLWNDHGLEMPDDPLVDGVAAFAHVVDRFFRSVGAHNADRAIVAHFHEWMGGLAIPLLRRASTPVAIVFTTHATRLGRQLAVDRPDLYEVLPHVDAGVEAARLGVAAIHAIERSCAHGSHAFTTVSEITGDECRYLLGRAPDVILPNGLNIQRFIATHYLQSLHAENKRRIEHFVRGHFFPYYSFDLDRTLYLFTSGRYEPRNKGFDLCLEALARLNASLQALDLGITVVFFVVTRREGARMSSQCLESRAVMRELEDTCAAITDQVGARLFDHVTSGNAPHLDDLVEEYWRLRLRRTVHAWRRHGNPPVVTHWIPDEDQVLNYIHGLWLANAPDQPVKVVYHPEFVTPANPLWNMEYDQMVRGCHLGVFPSAYEPWGYTPLECLASGVPAITSDLAGFGRYVSSRFPDHDDWGAYVLRRKDRGYHEAAAELAEVLLRFCRLTRHERIALRNRADEQSVHFDWRELASAYDAAHALALASSRP